jgi:hypothetical protein
MKATVVAIAMVVEMPEMPEMLAVEIVAVEIVAVTHVPHRLHGPSLPHPLHAKPRHSPAQPVALTTWMTTSRSKT